MGNYTQTICHKITQLRHAYTIVRLENVECIEKHRFLLYLNKQAHSSFHDKNNFYNFIVSECGV